MNTSDIQKILSKDIHAGALFANVFARDSFVEYARRCPRRDYAVVFNTHTSRQPGEHWIAYVRFGGEGWYFDSYGRPPNAYPDVFKALTIDCDVTKLLWNGERLQGLTTSACGDYCVLFILLSSRGWTFTRILSHFTHITDSERRDHAVRATLLRLYGPAAITTLRDRDIDYIGRDRLHVTSALYQTGLRFSY